MATVNKDFKIKSGLVVEGTTGTINGLDILTKKQADQDYIIGLIGGTATPINEPDTVVKRDLNGSFAAGTITVEDLALHSEGQIVIGAVGVIESQDNDDFYITAENGHDIRVTASDDLRMRALGGDVVITGNESGHIRFEDAPVHIGFPVTPQNEVSTKGYVDDAIQAIDLTYTTDDVTEGANLYFTNQRALDATASAYDPAGSAAAADVTARGYADSLASNYDVFGAAAAAQTAAEGFATQAIANLVDSAPATLDTLNELAAALQDNPDIISDLQDIAAGKQDTLTAGSNIDITADTISVVNLDSADISDFATAAQSAGTGYFDAFGAAAAAQTAAEDYANSLAVNYDAAGTAQGIVDALDTDDISEGVNNIYFTDSRAKVSAMDLLVAADKTNVTIEYNVAATGLVITAENGVADSDTDDLVEGSANLYFTNDRALNAISGSDQIQPKAIDISWVRREEATWTDVSTAGLATCHSASTSEGSMKYLVRVTASVGGTWHSHVTEVLATVDGSNGVAVVEYGTIYTSVAPLATVTVEWNASTSKYDLNVTTANNNSEVMVAATLIADRD